MKFKYTGLLFVFLGIVIIPSISYAARGKYCDKYKSIFSSIKDEYITQNNLVTLDSYIASYDDLVKLDKELDLLNEEKDAQIKGANAPSFGGTQSMTDGFIDSISRTYDSKINTLLRLQSIKKNRYSELYYYQNKKIEEEKFLKKIADYNQTEFKIVKPEKVVVKDIRCIQNEKESIKDTDHRKLFSKYFKEFYK